MDESLFLKILGVVAVGGILTFLSIRRQLRDLLKVNEQIDRKLFELSWKLEYLPLLEEADVQPKKKRGRPPKLLEEKTP